MDRTHIAFLRVAEVGNLTAAAGRLGVAQPSLTRTISQLESDFGTALFTRMPRGMVLTPAGEALLRHLRQMEAIYERAHRDVEAVRKGFFQTVRIGAGLTYQLLLVPEMLEEMWKRFPKTSFHVSTGSAATHTQMLLDGDLDIVITAAVDEYRNPDLDIRLLGQITHGVVHRAGTLPDIPAERPMPLDALEQHNWVLFEVEPESSTSLDQRFFQMGLATPKVALTTTSLQLGLDMVRSQGLIMSVPTLLRNRLESEGFLVHRTLLPLWIHDTGIAVHLANRDLPILTAMIEVIEELVDTIPAFSDLV